jgi:very-short-patch-repair endonuclease
LDAGLTGDAAVAKLAELQHGVVSRVQMRAVGLGEGAIKHRIEHAFLHRVHRGVYRLGHLAPIPFAREAAAVLACGERAAVSHRSAASLWALAPAPKGEVEVTVPPGGRRPRVGIRFHRSSLLLAEVTTCHGLPVTTPQRTLVDIARETPAPVLERAVADAQRRRLVARTALLRVEGAPRLRALVESEGGPAFTRSEAEARITRLLRKAGLPPADHNVQVAGHEVDLIWREERLVVEIDGYAYHSGRAAFERDRSRDADLMAAGLQVLRITWRQLADEPERVVALLASGLRLLRGPAAGRGRAAPPR